MKKLKIFTIILLTLAVIATLVILPGCKKAVTTTTTAAAETTAEVATTTSPSEKVVLTVWKGPHGVDDAVALLDAISAFESDHPNVTIELGSLPWDNFVEKMVTSIGAGNPPDLFLASLPMVGSYVERLLDYNNLFTKEEMQFLTKGVSKEQLESCIYKGKQFGIPYGGVTTGFAYNIDLLQEAGFKNPPDTLEELRQMAKVLTKDINNDGIIDQYGWGQLSYDTGEAKPDIFLYQYGDTLLNKDQTDIGYDNGAGLEAFKYIDQLWNIDKSAVPPGLYPGTTSTDAFLNGKFAMWITHSPIIKLLDKYPNFHLGVTVNPQGPGKELADGRGTWAGFSFWSIADNAKHIDLAKEFILYLHNPKYMVKPMEMFGYFPMSSEVKMKLSPLMESFNKNIPYGIPYPMHKKFKELQKVAIWGEISALQTGVKTPEQAFKDSVAAGRRILSE